MGGRTVSVNVPRETNTQYGQGSSPVSSEHNEVLGGWVVDGLGQEEGKCFLQAIVLLPVKVNTCNQKVVIAYNDLSVLGRASWMTYNCLQL